MDLLIPLRGRIYDFDLKDGYIESISVCVPNYDEQYFPSMTTHTTGPAKASIVIPDDPYLPEIQRELMAIEGLLSFYGVKSIEVRSPKLEWIPENDKDKAKLKVFTFSHRYVPMEEMDTEPVPHDLLVGSLIAACDCFEIEVPLNFFRKGSEDVFDRRYIEAIYDFYFLLETLYGDGKFRTKAVIDSFIRSSELESCVGEVLNLAGYPFWRGEHLINQFNSKYKNKSYKEIITQIVELRGFLHHHSEKRNSNWHPNRQEQYKMDAFFLQDVCFRVAFRLSAKYIFSDETKRIYESTAFQVKQSQTVEDN